LGVSRSSLGYRSRVSAKDAKWIPKLQAIAERNPTYGYRFAWALLKENGDTLNVKRVHRMWRRYGFSVQPRRRRRKIRTGKARVLAPTGPNQVWAYDFVHDHCANGQALKCLTVVDEWTRESLAIEVGTSIGAARVIQVLSRAMAVYGRPQILRSDNGPEFIARALRIWALMNGGEIATIDPGKPWQNGSVESFHSTFRRECLDRELFANLREARILIEQYRWEYNTQRPHSSLGYQPPRRFGEKARAECRESDRAEALVAEFNPSPSGILS